MRGWAFVYRWARMFRVASVIGFVMALVEGPSNQLCWVSPGDNGQCGSGAVMYGWEWMALAVAVFLTSWALVVAARTRLTQRIANQMPTKIDSSRG